MDHHKHAVREHAKEVRHVHEVKRDHEGEMRDGMKHLMEHHREERREVNRDHEEPHKSHAGHGELTHRK